MNYYLSVWRKYAQFSGRSQRAEYWYFVLFNALAYVAIGIVEGIIGTGGILLGLYGLAVVIPNFAVFIRRLHDTGHSGWWLLLGCVPLIGAIVLFVWMVTDSTPGDNAYGPNPKGIAAPAAPVAPVAPAAPTAPTA